jgi:hypothetical protein
MWIIDSGYVAVFGYIVVNERLAVECQNSVAGNEGG